MKQQRLEAKSKCENKFPQIKKIRKRKNVPQKPDIGNILEEQKKMNCIKNKDMENVASQSDIKNIFETVTNGIKNTIETEKEWIDLLNKYIQLENNYNQNEIKS